MKMISARRIKPCFELVLPNASQCDVKRHDIHVFGTRHRVFGNIVSNSSRQGTCIIRLLGKFRMKCWEEEELKIQILSYMSGFELDKQDGDLEMTLCLS